MDPNQPATPKRAAVEPFSRTNPPPSEAEALVVMDNLTATAASIEAKLDHTDPEDFPSDEQYHTWRQRAINALGFTRRELTFLERWLRERKRSAGRPGHHAQDSPQLYDDLQIVVQTIRDRVQELAAQIGGEYTPRYTPAHPPESMLAAHERMATLSGIRYQLQAAFSEITAAWISHPLRRADLSGIKSPLQHILAQVEVENGVVKGYIRTHEMQSHPPSWPAVLSRALSRAVAEGFALTPTEQAVLDQLQQSHSLG